MVTIIPRGSLRRYSVGRRSPHPEARRPLPADAAATKTQRSRSRAPGVKRTPPGRFLHAYEIGADALVVDAVFPR